MFVFVLAGGWAAAPMGFVEQKVKRNPAKGPVLF